MNSLVSIIVPVYNVENYLLRCINSILNQTYKDIELICVNDGSKDNSLQILESITDKRIKIINQVNQGLSVARNVGVKAASGKYIYFCDSDDYLELNTIEALCTFAENNDLDMVEGRTVYNYPNNNVAYSDIAKNLICDSTAEIYKFYLSDYVKTNAWSKLIRRDILINNNIDFIPHQISEDYIWLYSKLLKKLKKIGYCNEGCYYYFQANTSSITKVNTENHFNSYYDIFTYLINDQVFMDYHRQCNSILLGNLLYIIIRSVYLLKHVSYKLYKKGIYACKKNVDLLNKQTILHGKLLVFCCKIPSFVSFLLLKILFDIYRAIS